MTDQYISCSCSDMAVNSSSNDSLLHPWYCFITKPSSFILTAHYITKILLLLPVSTLVLYLGLQRRRRQPSTNTAATSSHSEFFTYHIVTMELVGVFGCTFSCYGIHGDHFGILSVGIFLWSFAWYGEIFFHMLTCVERYLAVVHPLTYMSLRGERGITIRNITVGCVWLLSIGTAGAMRIKVFVFLDLCLMIFSLITVVFCSVSVLCVLNRPGPGEQGGDRERVDQSKQRAFYTIMVILGVLLVRCLLSVAWCLLQVLRKSPECALTMTEIWFSLPSSLVLPLLFLHRAGTLACCKNNT